MSVHGGKIFWYCILNSHCTLAGNDMISTKMKSIYSILRTSQNILLCHIISIEKKKYLRANLCCNPLNSKIADNEIMLDLIQLKLRKVLFI